MSKDTILIIDDEIQIRMLLEITLSAKGYHIVEASTGKEGLTLASSVLPACIVLDLGLPDIDGHDVLKRLREWYFKPVIILSVRNTEDEISKPSTVAPMIILPSRFDRVNCSHGSGWQSGKTREPK